MIEEGHIVLFSFPQTDQTTGKLRPALVLRQCPGQQGDWLICMISSQLRHAIPGIDEIITQADPDFAQTGLKLPSVIRVTRLAVVATDILQGAIGALPKHRLGQVRRNIASWISGMKSASSPPDRETVDQHGGKMSSEGAPGAPLNESSP